MSEKKGVAECRARHDPLVYTEERAGIFFAAKPVLGCTLHSSSHAPVPAPRAGSRKKQLYIRADAFFQDVLKKKCIFRRLFHFQDVLKKNSAQEHFSFSDTLPEKKRQRECKVAFFCSEHGVRERERGKTNVKSGESS